MSRIGLLFAGFAVGAILASVAFLLAQFHVPDLLPWVARHTPHIERGMAGTEHSHDRDDEPVVKLSEAQVSAAGIVVAAVEAGELTRRLVVPGAILPSGDRIARVAVKLIGTVAELRKRLGDPVARDEIVAVIDSREVADAKSEYLAAKTTHDLQKTLFERAKTLWAGKVSTENDFLRARALSEDRRIKMEVARQKLSALGLTAAQIESLPDEPVGTMRLYELRSPIAGKIAERRVDLGAPVGREGQESELYTIVDLDVVWADLALPPADLASIRDGQELDIVASSNGARTRAKIIFISPLLERDTRSARVFAAIDNSSHLWRPGAFVTAEVPLDAQQADLVIPKAALQTIKGERVVFVRRDDRFEVRKVTTGREDAGAIEILSGLSRGDRIAVSNTFVLKAELGKAEAHHDH